VWVSGSDHEQSASGPRRGATPLLPILQCPDRHTEQLGKARLGQARLFSYSRDVGNIDHTAVLATLDLAKTLQDLGPDVTVPSSHLPPLCEREFSILIVRQVLPDESREEPRLDEAEHMPIVRQGRTKSIRGDEVDWNRRRRDILVVENFLYHPNVVAPQSVAKRMVVRRAPVVALPMSCL